MQQVRRLQVVDYKLAQATVVQDQRLAQALGSQLLFTVDQQRLLNYAEQSGVQLNAPVGPLDPGQCRNWVFGIQRQW